MTLTFDVTASTDIKALARVRRVSVTDKAAIAAMIAVLVARDLDRFSPPEDRQSNSAGEPKP